jgi:hypothetical protein
MNPPWADKSWRRYVKELPIYMFSLMLKMTNHILWLTPKGGERTMSEKDAKEPETIKKKDKTQTPEEPLPFCTTAPSAEQARGADGDEPCDDGRKGESE